MSVDKRRVRILKDGQEGLGPVVYVMGRDFRADDNWALLYAQQEAKKRKVPLGVLVHIGKNMLETTERQHHFFIEGLKETAAELEEKNIPFFITFGDWKKEVKTFVEQHDISLLVTDFSPLREKRWWWDEVTHGIKVPVFEVDAHNVIPAWLASDKQEFAARTFRTKVKDEIKEYFINIPATVEHPYSWGVSESACWPRGIDKYGCTTIDWDGVAKFRQFGAKVKPVSNFTPGSKAAKRALDRFIKERLTDYETKRNDPNEAIISDLSPYLRFGQISAQSIAIEVSKLRRDQKSKAAFLEELIVRRELSENYCLYNENYDNFAGLPDWAQKTLNEHRKDKREFIYTFEEFEHSKTHDDLWNAAQTQMVEEGKMHGFMRMYWAKKILEWTKTPEEAIEIALTLNDRYELDGRCPNGYVGVLWSIGGLHDRAWFERPVYGKIRYMNYNGCKRKFDVKAFINRYVGTRKFIPEEVD